ncbi:MAG TPA: hypothetical protein ENK10_08105, partial [Acidobacteria bacterium]|nr:hypothetical protein [Acidobacteriota bacterium]
MIMLPEGPAPTLADPGPDWRWRSRQQEGHSRQVGHEFPRQVVSPRVVQGGRWSAAMSLASVAAPSGSALRVSFAIAAAAMAGLTPPSLSQTITVDLQTDADAVRIDGEDLDDNLAYRAATCDINGDGVADLVIGDPKADGFDNSRNGCGEVSVILGRRSAWTGPLSLASERAIRFVGQHSSDQLGDAVACGDIDGDGFDDIVMCAPWADRERPGGWTSGQAHVVFGSPDLAGEIDLEVDPGMVIGGEFYGGS